MTNGSDTLQSIDLAMLTPLVRQALGVSSHSRQRQGCAALQITRWPTSCANQF
jgi:hypothetical protein